MRYSIAIPAFDEEARIAALLERLRAGPGPAPEEIVVCDSASRDATAEVVARMASGRPPVHLIRCEQPGKPAAWNRLMEEVTTPAVVFLDADVTPRAGCVSTLLARFEAGEEIVVGARRRPAGGSAVAWLFDPVVELCLVGCCYLVDRRAVLARLHSLGLQGMPEVFAEDIWLQSILEPGEFRVCQDAVVEVDVDSAETYRLIHARKRLVDHELNEVHPERGAALQDRHPEALRPLAQLRWVLSRPLSPATRARWIAGAGAKLIANLVWKRRIRRQHQTLLESYRREGAVQILRASGSTRARPGSAASLRIRPARRDPQEGRCFAELENLASGGRSPSLYGAAWKDVVADSFQRDDTPHSHRFVRFAESEGEIVGHAALIPERERAASLRGRVGEGWPARRARIVRALRTLRGARTLDPLAGEWHLASLAVSPRRRRLGVARALLEEGIQRARAQGGRWVGLDVDPRNDAAIQTYRRLGFEPEPLLQRPGSRAARPERWVLPLDARSRAQLEWRRQYTQQGFVAESFDLDDPRGLPALIRDTRHFDDALEECARQGQARVPYLFTEAIERVSRDAAIERVVEGVLGTREWVVWGPNIRRETPNAAHRWHVDLESWYWPSVTVVLGLRGCTPESATWCRPGTHLLSRAPTGARAEEGAPGRSVRDPSLPASRQIPGFGDGRFYVMNARTWHRGDPAASGQRLALFLHYQRADAPRIPFMLDYDRRRWSRDAAAYQVPIGVDAVQEVARPPWRERVAALAARGRR